MIKKFLQNVTYKLLVALVEHKSDEIDERHINDWLLFSYKHQGFKDYLTNEYTKFSRYILSAHRSDYQSVLDKKFALMQLEKKAKDLYEKVDGKKNNNNN